MTWRCLSCGKEARAGKPFDFKPFARFPLAPTCPYCFEKGSMRPVREKESLPVLSSPSRVKPCVKFKFVIGKEG